MAVVLLIGSCVFGGSNDRSAKVEAEATPEVAPQTTIAESGPESTSSDAPAPSPADVSEAEGTVAFIIGLNGYHCIKVIDVQAAGSGVYDVTCVTDHHGHRAIYMVNSRTNDVAEI